MEKLGLGCPFIFLAGKPQETNFEHRILQLNYDCYLKIFSYLTALEDQLNLARSHPLFRSVVVDVLRTRCFKINIRMLKNISDWQFLLGLCGSEVVRCEVPHGRWDDGITIPFLALLGRHCPNLRQMVMIFMHTDTETPPPASGDSGCGIMRLLLELHGLTNLTLIDARAAQLEQLKHFSNLQTLDLDGIDQNLSVAAFEQMFHNKDHLCRLLLNFGRGFRRTHQVPKLENRCLHLEHLTLENFDVNIRDLGEFRELLSLRLISRWIVEVNNDFYRSLVKRYAEQLQKLQLISVRVREDQVSYILAISGLRALDCDNWPIQSLEELSQFNRLECLALDCVDSTRKVTRPLSLVVKNCSNLEHLKLGRRWQMASADVEELLGNFREIRSKSKKNLLLTLAFKTNTDAQEKLINLVQDLYSLRLSFDGATCHHCQQDTHSKCDTIFD